MTTHIQFNGKPVERPDAPRIGVIGCGIAKAETETLQKWKRKCCKRGNGMV